LVVDGCIDVWEEFGRSRCEALRCVNCGAIEDAIIRANRRRSSGHLRPKSLAAISHIT
jgi:hypothetical protein